MERLIKRYDNRKLYDTVSSSYISLEEIGDCIRAGENVRIVDKTGKKDLTARILSQVILEEGKKGVDQPPSSVLHEWIRHGEEFLSTGIHRMKEGLDEFMEEPLRGIFPERNEDEPELKKLRARIDKLESSVNALESKLKNNNS